jgi:uncharacterized protein
VNGSTKAGVHDRRRHQRVVILAETEGYWPELRSALEQGRINGPQVRDARVAAICQDHGVRELWTADRDFGRFPALNVHNPFVG